MFLQKVNYLNVLIIILIAPLYILYFGESISDKIVSILTSIAAIASTFFLFLAFKENRKSNKFKMVEYLYSELESKVIVAEKKAKDPVYTENTETICRELNFPKNDLMKITFSKFIWGISNLLSHLEKDLIYLKYKKLTISNLKTKLNDESMNEIKNIEFIVTGIWESLLNLTMYYKSLNQLYLSIDKFPIDIELKILLFERLKVLSPEYDSCASSFLKQDGHGYYIGNYIFFQIQKDELVWAPNFFDSLNEISKEMKAIAEKYKDEKMRLDPLTKSFR